MDERLAALESECSAAIAAAREPHAEVYVHDSDKGFARFSRGELDQHVALEESKVVARVALKDGDGWRVASYSTNSVERRAIANAIRQAAALARTTPVREGWPGLTEGDGSLRISAQPADGSMASFRRAEDRVAKVLPILTLSRAHNLWAAGAYEATETRAVIVNSRGVRRAGMSTFSTCKVFALDADRNSGFSQRTARDPAELHTEIIAQEAVDKCLAGKDPIALPAGEYDVVLEPPAVVELLEWLAFTTFGARELADGTSAFTDRIGTQITGQNITLVDRDDGAFGLDFDREGTDRSRVVLIENGIAKGAVYDRYHAAQQRIESTGHAAPVSAFEDTPLPQALTLFGGDRTTASMVAGLKRGLHISRFHYVNGFLEPRRTLMTGLTRDGTFLIENGERARGVRNMRFTDSVFEAFSRCEGLSQTLDAVPTWWSDSGAFRAPAMLIRGLRFTGAGVEPPRL
jgi:predicted Zn-dependent protease